MKDAIKLLMMLGANAALPLQALAHPHNDGSGASHSHAVHENGVGADPDHDGNPATDTGGISLSGDAAEAEEDPPYEVITFEPPPGDHGDKIRNAYWETHGVKFGEGLTRQICRGQRHFQYDTMCTYEAAPSGAFAAGYMNYLNRPLEIEFKNPACVVTLAIYPTGAKEGEPFELLIDAWDRFDEKLPQVIVPFDWTKDTVRWRHMAGVYYLGRHASKISIGMRSLDPKEKKEVLRFLIDDFAYVGTGCEAALDDLKARAGDATVEVEDIKAPFDPAPGETPAQGEPLPR